MDVKNQEYKATVSLVKGAGDGATAMGSGGVAGVVVYALLAILRNQGDVPWDEGQDDMIIGGAVAVGSGLFQAFKRWRRNRKKHRMKTIAHPLSASGS